MVPTRCTIDILRGEDRLLQFCLYLLVNIQKAIENCHSKVEILDLPIKNGGSFHGYVAVYQRVNPTNYSYLPQPSNSP